MFYGLARMLISAIILILSFILKNKFTKRKILFGFLCLVIVIAMLWVTPLENLFVSFYSPQAVFEYAGQGEIVDIIEGSESAALITKKKEGVFSTYFVMKQENKYKIAPVNAATKISTQYYDSVALYIYHVRETDDYYLRIWGTVSKEMELSDTENTDFSIIYESFSNKQMINVLEKIDFSAEYHCFINGNEITFD